MCIQYYALFFDECKGHKECKAKEKGKLTHTQQLYFKYDVDSKKTTILLKERWKKTCQQANCVWIGVAALLWTNHINCQWCDVMKLLVFVWVWVCERVYWINLLNVNNIVIYYAANSFIAIANYTHILFQFNRMKWTQISIDQNLYK